MKKEDLKVNDEVTIVDKEQLLKILKEKDLYIGGETREFIAEKVSGVKAKVVDIKNNTVTLMVGESGYFLPFEAIVNPVLTGIEEIAKERKEQIQKHGFSIDHDVNYYTEGQLVDAAVGLLTDNSNAPDNWNVAQYNKMIGKSGIEKLIIAGALIAAEIDRFKTKA